MVSRVRGIPIWCHCMPEREIASRGSANRSGLGKTRAGHSAALRASRSYGEFILLSTGVNQGRKPTSLLRLVNAEHSTIPEVFAARARLSPNKTFLLWRDEIFSYAESLGKVEGFAGFLQTVNPSSTTIRVATYLENCPEAMWAWLGTMFAGGVLIPLNRQHKGALLEDMIRRGAPDIFITEASALGELPDFDSSNIQLVITVGSDFADQPRNTVLFRECYDPHSLATVHAKPTDQACAMFTSGTTGRSKAVRIPHNQYCRGASRLVDGFELNSNDVFHNWLPLYHLGGQLHMTMTAIIAGATVALSPKFSLSAFRSDMERHEISVICGFAAILKFIWSLPEVPGESETSLRVGIFAGIPTDLHKAFEARFGMMLGENYGMTEADPITHPRPGLEPPLGSCGPRGEDFDIAIADDEGHPLATGKVGEIIVRSRVPGVMFLGYEGDEAATRKSFIGEWFRTGDLGLLDKDGFLYFKGRGSSYIRRRGENVSISELESIILTHPGIAECVAVAVPSEVGEDDIKLVVVPSNERDLKPEDVYKFARSHMAPFMVPRYIEIVSKLPKGSVGKVLLTDIKEIGPEVWDSERSAKVTT